jgi:hypothetical protein
MVIFRILSNAIHDIVFIVNLRYCLSTFFKKLSIPFSIFKILSLEDIKVSKLAKLEFSSIHGYLSTISKIFSKYYLSNLSDQWHPLTFLRMERKCKKIPFYNIFLYIINEK